MKDDKSEVIQRESLYGTNIPCGFSNIGIGVHALSNMTGGQKDELSQNIYAGIEEAMSLVEYRKTCGNTEKKVWVCRGCKYLSQCKWLDPCK